jgi:hypothetical protein
MAITSIKTGSSFTNLVKYNDFLGPNSAYIPSSYESIATVSGSGTNSLTFTSIPSTYKHLQIRGLGICSSATQNFRTQFNADTGTNYIAHVLSGNGSTVTATGTAASSAFTVIGGLNAGVVTTYPNVFILDIIDYASTTKYKTIKSFFGADNNSTGGSVDLASGLWMSTTAISEIKIYMSTGNLNTNTTFALYGIKG